LFSITKSFSFTDVKKINNKRTYYLDFTSDFKNIIDKLELFIKPKKIIDNDYKKRAYLAGAFLSGGSISSLDKKMYHLEIRSTNVDYLRIIQKLLLSFNISISLSKRSYSYVLYIKRSEDISDFLKIIGAYENMQYLEDIRISRDLNNQIHRLNNLDISNIKKASEAGSNQAQKIKKIRQSKEYIDAPIKFKNYCELRLKYPEISLKEIVEKFNKNYHSNLTKSGVNHYGIKINKIYQKIMDKQ